MRRTRVTGNENDPTPYPDNCTGPNGRNDEKTFMTLTTFLSPAQCFGYAALVVGVWAFLQKDDQRLRFLSASQSIIYMIHFALLGLPAAAAGALVSGMRMFLSLKTRSPWAAAAMLAAGGGLGIYLAHDPFGYLPVVATSIGTLAIFFSRGIRMRQALLCCTFMWLVNNLHGGSIGGTILECIIATTNSFTIMRMIRERREGKLASCADAAV